MCVCVCVCVCARVRAHMHGKQEMGEGRVREAAQKSSGLLVMGLWVVLIFFFKLLFIFKIFNNDYALLFELEKNP